MLPIPLEDIEKKEYGDAFEKQLKEHPTYRQREMMKQAMKYGPKVNL